MTKQPGSSFAVSDVRSWRMRRFAWVVPSGAVLLVAAILAINGFPHGRDWPYELTRIAEMREAWAGGQSPPFWAPDEYHGFGSPVFLYYAPLYATVASLFTTIAEVPDAAIIAIVLAVIAAAWMMRATVTEVAGPRAAGLAVIASVLHPYFLADIWIRNANAEVTALALFPGVIAGAVSPRPGRRFWWTFLSLGAVILAHNLTALVAITISVCVSAFVQRSLRAVVPVFAGILCALAVTAFFWLPAMAMRSLAVRDEALIEGKFDFHRNFPRPAALVVLNPPSEYSSGGYLGALMVVAIVVAAIRWRGGDEHGRRIVRACAITIAVLVFFMLPISTPAWEYLPLIRYLQFPWRLVGPLGVVSIIGCATLVAAEPRAATLRWSALFLVIAVVNALPVLLIYPRMERADMRRFTALLTPEGIRDRGLRTVVGNDYLPRHASMAVIRAGSDPIMGVTRGLSIRDASTNRGNAHLTVTSASGGVISFRRWFFPVWNAAVDGSSSRIVETPGGVVGVPVPPGEHKVDLTLVEPLSRTVTKAFSAVAAAGIAAIALRIRRRRRTHFVNTVTSADEPAGT